jgi:hypothetical protein
MSPPIGGTTGQPGKIIALQLRTLAAEMSDGGRLGRGKQLWADGAVLDLDTANGCVVASVQGTRPAPYDVVIRFDPGTGAPIRSEIEVQCGCPDDLGTGDVACKHVVAVLFEFSEEVSIDPERLRALRAADIDRPARRTTPRAAPRHTVTTAAPGPRSAPPPHRAPHELDDLVVAPAGTELPEVPILGTCIHPPLRRLELGPEIDAALADARSMLWPWQR